MSDPISKYIDRYDQYCRYKLKERYRSIILAILYNIVWLTIVIKIIKPF